MSDFYVLIGDRELKFTVGHTEDSTTIALAPGSGEAKSDVVDFVAVHSNPQTGEGLYSLLVDNRSYQLYLTPGRPTWTVELSRHRLDMRVLTEREWRLDKIAPKEAVFSGKTSISAPMPGLIKQVLVSAGDEVQIGSRLLVLEAMKMENDIVSPRDGRVAEVFAAANQVVEGGKPLLDIE